ncbi:MAG: Tetratricopeptide 2 repeat protein [Rhizorhabdus sp.]|nr:Tetratricopeptide 2 repeat protein [Rhizorhabdus sp.]
MKQPLKQTENDVTESAPAKRVFTLSAGRVILILAALIAVTAVALSILKSRGTPTPPAPESTAPAGDVPAMIAGLEKKMAANPQDAEGWNMLGWSYYNVGRYADAVKAYGRATAIDPKNATYWSALGEVIILSGPGGVTPDAEQAFAKALAIDPNDFRARYFTGVKQDQDGDHKGALDRWIALLKDSPAGAPWEDAVRGLIDRVSKANNIDVADRVPPRRAPAPAAAPDVSVATAAIPGPTAGDMQAATGMTPGEQNAMVQGMVDRLAAKLAANPRDGDGWIRLMRARMVLNDPSAAQAALAKAKAAFAGDTAEIARLDAAAQTLGVPR